jgi:4-azaleucine resistance transporter AzlC
MQASSEFRSGVHAALPLVLPTLALGASFGVLAEPVIGAAAALVMSILVFSGGAQFAALSVLQAGGGAAAATVAGLLMNTRWLPMSFALAPSLQGSRRRKAAEAQAIVDASFVLADRGDGTFSPDRLIGATLPQVSAWIAGTAFGLLLGSRIPSPDGLGLDAIFPAFYLTLLVEEASGRRTWLVILLAALVTLVLLPWAPAGLPVITASLVALIGLRRA